MQAQPQNQEPQFNVHTEIQGRQMHSSGGEQAQAQVKGQQEMRYEGAAGQEPKSTEHQENPRRSDV